MSRTTGTGEEDENGSICCDIYIDGDEQQTQSRKGSKTPLHVAAVLRGAIQHRPPSRQEDRRKCCSGCWWAVMVCLVVAAVAVALGVGIGALGWECFVGFDGGEAIDVH